MQEAEVITDRCNKLLFYITTILFVRVYVWDGESRRNMRIHKNDIRFAIQMRRLIQRFSCY